MKILYMTHGIFRPASGIRRTGAALALGLGLAAAGSFPSAVAAEAASGTGEIKPDLIYHNYCSVCHGERGDGRSRASKSLVPPPRDLTAASDLTREAMIATVTHGKPGTAMVAWETQLTAKDIAAVVDFIRGSFMLPALDPHIARGRSVYGHNCTSCHGDRGQGVSYNGAAAPRDWSSPETRAKLTRERMIAAVTGGQHGAETVGFSEKITAQDIEAVVDYASKVVMMAGGSISGRQAYGGRQRDAATSQNARKPETAQADMTLPMPRNLTGNMQRGGQFYMGNCATCHGVNGDGQGPRAYFINPRVRNFQDDYSHTQLNRPAIFRAVTLGRTGSEMPAWGKVLSEQEIADVTEFVFQTFIRK